MSTLSVLVALTLVPAGRASDALPALSFAQLPPAVQAALKKGYPNRSFDSAVRDERNDYVYFLVTFADDAEPRSVSFDENGAPGEPPLPAKAE